MKTRVGVMAKYHECLPGPPAPQGR